jgi:predicted DCC family thiol-disulfide oxidoreductase YuxK
MAVSKLYLCMQRIIFFDGLCNLCNGAVQFTIERDPQHKFQFASLQSDFAQEKLAAFEGTAWNGDSFVFLENDHVYQRSTAALKVARQLSGWWPLLYVFMIIPSFIRDGVYHFIAKHRYKWFGKKESCWIPSPSLRSRFLDQ